uniref:Chitin-binding type-1 domain-containing protein n=1 Tax=Araucaria cunninghamii TaxID=56994 RepID=A0A0D6QS17_ARACU
MFQTMKIHKGGTLILFTSLFWCLLVLAWGQNCGCPSEMCCSRYGYCGNDAEYCGGGCSEGPCFGKNGSTPGGFNVLNDTKIKDLFNSILFNTSDSCEGKRFYSFDSFLRAATAIPAFGSTGSTDIAKREVAAFLANMVLNLIDGFCYINALKSNASDYCDRTEVRFPCASGKNYHGRGPSQLTWNSNYGLAAKYLKLDLLKDPDLASTNSTISFETALWFWTSGSDYHLGVVSGQGFVEAVAGLTSCSWLPQIPLKIETYKTYCQYLGVDPGTIISCEQAANKQIPSEQATKKLIPILLGSIGGPALLCFLFLFFFCRLRLKRHKADTGFPLEEHSTFSFSYKVLEEATSNFSPANKLGEGGFGEIYKGTLSDGKQIAVKKLFVTRSSQAMMEEFVREVKIVSGFLHRNLVRLLGYCCQGQQRFLVYEFMPHLSLDKHLFEEKGIYLSWAKRLEIIIGTAQGLAYLHEQSHARVVHRDIKASNILLDENLKAKIADFGLAKLFPEDKTHLMTSVGGTIGYTAPECALHGQLTQKADVYSYGVVVLEIVSGKKCNDTGLPHPMDVLLQWVWSSYQNNEGGSIVDLRLHSQTMSENERRQILRVIHIALLCVQSSSVQRPSMSTVLSMLTSEGEILDVPGPPALLGFQPHHMVLSRPPDLPTASSSTSHGSITLSLLPR